MIISISEDFNYEFMIIKIKNKFIIIFNELEQIDGVITFTNNHI